VSAFTVDPNLLASAYTKSLYAKYGSKYGLYCNWYSLVYAYTKDD